VWEDPYLLGAEREKTLLQDVDMGIALEGAFGTGAQISYRVHMIDVGDDVAGERDRDLRRDGRSHSFGIGYQVPLHEGAMLIPQAAYEKGMFEGRSNGYSGCGLGLAYSVTAGQISARTSFEYGLKSYDHIHPVFNEKRKEDSRSASVYISYIEPFGFKNTSFHLMGDYRVTDASIVFYDAREAMTGAGIGYSF